MHEFDSVSVSSFEAAALAAKLTEKSADGWDVVAIVPAGQRRHRLPEARRVGDAADVAADEPSDDRRPPSRVGRRADAADRQRAGRLGHGARARRRAPAHVDVGPVRRRATAAGASAPTTLVGTGGWGVGRRRPRRPPQQRRPRRPQPATPSVPAGWYADPAGRFELRYWDGWRWTEHVSRAGQQYTDPPVA